MQLNATSQYVNLFGTRMHYQTAGKGEPVLLIHGLGGSTMAWVYNMDFFSKHFQVFALDLPGHGYSDKPTLDVNLPAGAKYVKAFWDAVGLESLSVVGNSVGGLVALRLALEHPERVKRLVLVDSAGLGREVALFLRLMSLPFLGEIMARPSKATIRALIKVIFYDPSVVPDEFIDYMYSIRTLPGRQETMLKALRSGANLFGQKPSVLQLKYLSALKVPTLLVWGAEDRLTPVRQATAAKGLIPEGSLHIFSQCGHWPQMEKAREFNELVADFLASKTDGRSRA